MRRRVLVPALVAGCAFGMLPAPASPYVGDSALASAAVIIRGVDGVGYQIEVAVAQHVLAGAKSDYELRIRLAKCNDSGCFGSWYDLPVAAKDVRFTNTTASVATKFAGASVVVTWQARKSKAAAGTPSPAVHSSEKQVNVTTYRQDRSAPAVVSINGLRCATRSSHMTNQSGARVVVPDPGADGSPRRLPTGFYATRTRKPRCV